MLQHVPQRGNFRAPDCSLYHLQEVSTVRKFDESSFFFDRVYWRIQFNFDVNKALTHFIEKEQPLNKTIVDIIE